MYLPQGENIIETRKCRITGEEFVITDGDMVFFEKYDIQLPTLCPREIWRSFFGYRNEWNLFRRKCSKTGQEILSCFRDDTVFPAYNHKLWWSDDWSAFEYGRDFDFSRTFFDQYKSLQDVVPRVGTTIFNSENCDYNSHARYSKDCYLCSLFTKSEQTYYSYWTVEGKIVFNSAMTTTCENIDSCLDVTRCTLCFSCQECRDCQECYFSYELRNCQNCIACSGLTGKQYHVYNKPVTKEEYEKTLKLITGDQAVWDQAHRVFEKIRAECVRPASQFINAENCSGDHLQNCRDAIDCFDAWEIENCRHCINFGVSKDSIWCYSLGMPNGEACAFNCVTTNVYDVRYSFYIFDSKNLAYCDSCRNSSSLFGCVGINHGEFALLNKAYSQHEYEALRAKATDHMKSTGEWGEFFPLSMSPYPYEDTAAMDWYPLSEAEVLKRGGRWAGDIGVTGDGQAESLLHISQYDEKIVGHETASKNIDHVLKTVFRCPLSGKPFQIIRQELLFHIRNSIPLPTLHPRERNKELMKLRNARELHDRNCSECSKEIQTTYKSGGAEKVLCDTCYLKHIY